MLKHRFVLYDCPTEGIASYNEGEDTKIYMYTREHGLWIFCLNNTD